MLCRLELSRVVEPAEASYAGWVTPGARMSEGGWAAWQLEVLAAVASGPWTWFVKLDSDGIVCTANLLRMLAQLSLFGAEADPLDDDDD